MNKKYQMPLPGIGKTIHEKVETALMLLKTFEPNALTLNPDNGYYLADSYGKDSCCILKLAEMSGVKFKSYHNLTTIDPPELIRFGKKHHTNTIINRPEMNFFRKMETKGLPSRLMRWCCEKYKENGGGGQFKILGIRSAESARRKNNWKQINAWDGKGGGFVCNPILHWTDDDVWEFIDKYNINYCSLYDDGFKRLGCIGCPMAGYHRREEFKRWPGYEKLWKRGCKRYFESHAGKKNRQGNLYYVSRFDSWEDFWEWWLSDNPAPKDNECTMGLF